MILCKKRWQPKRKKKGLTRLSLIKRRRVNTTLQLLPGTNWGWVDTTPRELVGLLKIGHSSGCESLGMHY
uniref:Uncharacterized protein n=1 Tax=Medicago truncatula TaxID=3880 RepID=I3S0L2_MEDTR|nr:unknown [Medicago truncatula]